VWVGRDSPLRKKNGVHVRDDREGSLRDSGKKKGGRGARKEGKGVVVSSERKDRSRSEKGFLLLKGRGRGLISMT